jgi:hypothetical protein
MQAKKEEKRPEELFRSHLDRMIDMKYPLCRLASAMENADVNGDGDTDDGLTLTVNFIQGVINDLTW